MLRRFLPAAPTLCLLTAALAQTKFQIPPDYFRQPDGIPVFWINTVDEVNRFLDTRIQRGKVITIGKTAGGRPMRAVVYGTPRPDKGTTTFSGSLGLGDVRAFLGAGHEKRVYMATAAVHGGEYEGIVGIINLLSVLETGKDLRSKPWPLLTGAAQALDRIILIPITNVDGRARVPVRMLAPRGSDHTIQEYFNTGGWPDGKLIGWPAVKRHIPLDFSKTQFPGGYPNDAGVNIQHDDFFSARRQPETTALLDLTARERPDLILNMHTGASFIQPLRPFIEPALIPAWEELYRRVRTLLAQEGLQSSSVVAKVADPTPEKPTAYNLETALNLNCGALAALVESPAHSFSTSKRDGKPFQHTPQDLLNAQLLTHQEAMVFLLETGGRIKWTAANVPRPSP